jgi:putative intracellular protease/amidase
MAIRKVVRLGVFIPTECQLLDQACVDILATLSHEYLQLLANVLPQAVIDLSPSIKIHYIGSVKPGQPISLTANQKIVATNHYSDAEVAPGQLDIIIVPGPDPNTVYKKGDGAVEWLRNHGAQKGTDILSVCTGIFLCGEAGLLNGRTVCGPRGMQDIVKAKYGKDIVMKGSELRWVQDGNFWSSGESI